MAHQSRVSQREQQSNSREYAARESDDMRNLKLFADMAYRVPGTGQGTLDFTEPPQTETEHVNTHLSPEWCRCGKDSRFGSYPEDGECRCGVWKHHVHCGRCGRVSQIG